MQHQKQWVEFKMVATKQSLFFKAKDPRLARDISITSPAAFRKSIKILKKGGITLKEMRALQLAKNRGAAQLKRKNLSSKEKKQFRAISKINIPKVNSPRRNV